MKNGNGNGRDVWVVVNRDGHGTLYELVEVEKGNALQLARELHAPTVVVDMALPALPALDETPEWRCESGNSRLILVNVSTSTGADAKRTVVRHFCRQASKPVRSASSD